MSEHSRGASYIWKNLIFSFLLNGVGLPVAAGGPYPLSGMSVSPMFADAAMALLSFTVVMNTLRLNRAKLQ